MIELQGQGYRGAAGRSSHTGCVNWEDGNKVLPYLTWRQMDRLVELVPTANGWPEDILRILGAIHARRPAKLVHGKDTDLGALKLGEDLYRGYKRLLAGLERTGRISLEGDEWRPRLANGHIWIHPKQIKQAASS
jgi:hypothetical protein